MDSKRIMHLRDSIGYDNPRMASMLNIDLAVVEEFCNGRKTVFL